MSKTQLVITSTAESFFAQTIIHEDAFKEEISIERLNDVVKVSFNNEETVYIYKATSVANAERISTDLALIFCKEVKLEKAN